MRWLAVGLPKFNNQTRLWNLTTGSEQQIDAEYADQFVFNPAGTQLAIAQRGRTDVIEFATGKIHQTMNAGKCQGLQYVGKRNMLYWFDGSSEYIWDLDGDKNQ